MASSKLKIAVARGDGIGPEIMAACLKVFDAARVPLSYNFVDMGKDWYLKGFSTGMTPQAQAMVESTGLLFKGPMETPKGSGVKSINVTARKVWNTFANKRVFESLAGIDTVFARAGIPIDLTLVRENIEDTYGGIEHFQSHDVAQCRRLITRPGSTRVHQYAFETARRKNARRVTCAHKANIMKLTDGLFLETFYQVAKDYPDIPADDIIVDDLAMKLTMKPNVFDHIVLPNLQGDIISDLCAGLVGGLGMAPSANIGDNISIFEAVHGTAPDIAGKNLANPTALLLSGLMMLRHVGLGDKADFIHTALVRALQAGFRTGDLFSNTAGKGTPAVPAAAAPSKPSKKSTKTSASLTDAEREHGDAKFEGPIPEIPTAPAADPALPRDRPLSTSEFAEAVIRFLPPQATVAPVQVKWIITPPTKPAQHIMKVSPRQPETERVVGIDLFIDSAMRPPELAAALQVALKRCQEHVVKGKLPDLALSMLSNRGTQVWPTGSMFTECINTYPLQIRGAASHHECHRHHYHRCGVRLKHCISDGGLAAASCRGDQG